MLIKKIILSLLVMSLVFGAIPFMGVMANDGSNNIISDAIITTSSNSETISSMIDGDKTTRWTSAYGAEHWVELEWNELQCINNVKMLSGHGKGTNGYQIIDFELLYWDGANWVSIEKITGNTQDGQKGQYNDMKFTAVETNKLRIHITDGSDLDDPNDVYSYARILELEVYTKKDPAFSDDFSAEKHVVASVPASPWVVSTNANTSVTVAEVDGNKCIALTTADNCSGLISTALKAPFDALSEKLIIKAKINMSDKAFSKQLIVRQTSNNAKIDLLSFGTSGYMSTSNFAYDLGAYTLGADYKLMFVIDVPNHSFDIYINDMTKPVKVGVPLNDAISQIDQLELTFYNSGVTELPTTTTYLDDVMVIDNSSLNIVSYPEDGQINVMPGTDVSFFSKTGFVTSAISKDNVSDNGAGIIDSIVKDDNKPNSFAVKLNSNVKPNTTYSITLKNIEMNLYGVIPPRTVTFTTEGPENFWFRENFQNSKYVEGEFPAGWTLKTGDESIFTIKTVPNSSNAYYSVDNATNTEHRAIKMFDRAYSLSLAKEINIDMKVLLNSDTSSEGINKRIRLLTNGDAPMNLLHFNVSGGKRTVQYYSGEAPVGSAIILSSLGIDDKDWMNVHVVLDTENRTVKAYINDVLLDGGVVCTYPATTVAIDGFDTWTKTGWEGRYDGLGIDDIKIYPTGTGVETDLKLYSGFGTESQQEISNLQSGTCTIAGKILNRTANVVPVLIAGYKGDALVSLDTTQTIPCGKKGVLDFSLDVTVDETVDTYKLIYIRDYVNLEPLFTADVFSK